jgi:hypothetical protein
MSTTLEATNETIEMTTTCDACGKTGPINSTNFDPIREMIVCPSCDQILGDKDIQV